MVYSAEDLKAETLEALFRPQMSPTGSSNRQEEERVLGYWLDYLIAVKGIFCMLFKVAVLNEVHKWMINLNVFHYSPLPQRKHLGCPCRTF